MTEETTTTETVVDNATAEKNQAEAFKRLQQKNADLETKLEEKETAPKVEVTEPETGSAEFIQQVVKHEAKKETAVSEFLLKYPAASEYAADIRKRLADPNRAKVPIDEVIRGAIPLDDFLKMGAALKEKELKDAEEQTMGGGDAKTKTKTTKQQAKAARYMDSLPKGYRPSKT